MTQPTALLDVDTVRKHIDFVKFWMGAVQTPLDFANFSVSAVQNSGDFGIVLCTILLFFCGTLG